MAPNPNSKKRQRDEAQETHDTLEKGEEPLSDKAIEELAKTETTFGAARGSKRPRVEASRSLFVRSLPPNATNESLTEFFSQHYPVKHSTVVIDQKTKESRGYGFVTFADQDDAKDAKEKLDSVEWEGRKLRLDVAEPRARGGGKEGKEKKPELSSAKQEREAALEESRRPAKLIVRNLPWSVKKPQDLAKLFQSFGKIKHADLPNTNGKLKGFGFVTMRRRKHAQKALETINEKEVDGRTLAVDWAVDKEVWEEQLQKDEKKPVAEDASEAKDSGEESSMQFTAMVDTAKEVKDKKKGGQAERETTPTADEDLAAFMANHMDDLESESDFDEEDEEEDEDGGVKLDNDDLDDSDGKEVAARQHPKKNMVTDNSSTLFIRNLPYTATDDQVKALFAHFGPVRYARVVKDKATDRPAGTAFVCFFNPADCKACIMGAPRRETKPSSGANMKRSVLHDETVDPDGKYTLDGRVLQVAQAVSKDEVSRFSKDGDDTGKDKRRLFLLSEGVITPSSPLFSLLAPSEIKMRDTSLAQRKKLVQSNPTLHISLTRLAIRNIPRNMTPKELKELARKAVVGFATDVKQGLRKPLSKEENARGADEAREAEQQRRAKNKGLVKQAKLIFETVDGAKAPMSEGSKSRGYGFIEYWTHRSALMALRFLNAHQLQDDRGKKQRLIAEFAIENAQVVNRRNQQQVKSREAPQKKPEVSTDKLAPWGGKEGAKGGKPNGNGTGRNGSGQSKAERAEGRKEDIQQTLIARKRMVRKKKARARS
ncbi:related to nucleolar protein NOP4 (NOP77) [Cephalotrichum gorgonifer]|uniref:Related to nucleolar protein NOP4 (NOP77) n=1 Tax=Cephalotrichum gorgonifer TaxID=2041049 RepID=A0AAE8SRL2_9PEZI|nr:related to nucleolar protein NOP4 (NOP77) [Cephalotrichum gorgonifer]